MVRCLSSLVVLMSAGMAEACPSFGFDTPYLSDYFCSQLESVAGPTTRSVETDGSANGKPGEVLLTHPQAKWLELPVIQEAWRSDPAKTLRLIERIRDAGGRPMK